MENEKYKKPLDTRREIYERLKERGINLEPDSEMKEVLEREEVETTLKDAIKKKANKIKNPNTAKLHGIF